MHAYLFVTGLLLSAGQALAAARPPQPRSNSRVNLQERHSDKIKPKVLIVNLFDLEAVIWYEKPLSSKYGVVLAHNISVPGLSPIYPQVHCTKSGELCQVTMGESEINAAGSISSLLLSTAFDFMLAYFLINGIAGVNPKLGTVGTVALSKFTVQVGLQYEFDAREMPENTTTGYVGYGNNMPNQYPTTQYGTEVMEVNEALRDIAFDCASKSNLRDATAASEYRAKYASNDGVYAAGVEKPGVVKCDSATSDVYYTGGLLSEAFENTTKIRTNQTDLTYCMTTSEEQFLYVRTASDFDRPPPGSSAYYHFFVADQGGFEIAVENLYNAGIEIINEIVKERKQTFNEGIKSKNYIGDIFGSLGGQPNFGPGSIFKGQ